MVDGVPGGRHGGKKHVNTRHGTSVSIVGGALAVATVLALGLGTPAAAAGPAPTAERSVGPPRAAAMALASSATPAPSDTGTPDTTDSPEPTQATTEAPSTTNAPTDEPTDAPSTAAPLGGADPSLAVQNAAHDHAMGSTIPSNTAVAGTRSLLAPQALAAAAGPAGVRGLDVSGWQTLTRANWTTIYKNGARFAYVKATESTDYTSSQFSEQYGDSYAAGLMHGAYHFATPNTSSGATQASYFVAHGGGWSADGRTLPPLLDIEYNPYGATCYGLSQSAMVSWISSFSSRMRSLTGRYPAIYSTTDWWTQCTGNSRAFSSNPLFIARYTTSSSPGTLPASWSKYTFWQWADSGVFPGDQDVFNGSTTQLAKFARTDPAPGANVDTTKLKPGVKIGTGWSSFNTLLTGDLNKDGVTDIIGRRPDSTLWYYAGTGAGRVKPGVRIGTGWSSFNTLLTGDLNKDGVTDIIGRRPDSTLWYYAGTGSGTLRSGIKIGVGWSSFNTLLTGDLNKDGITDIIGRKTDSTLWDYAGTGAG
jgi:GH25 family lysozyme M1 (1,4-beta-N-acetylmuramidase)